MGRSLGIVIPAYQPDVAVLLEYLTAIRSVVSPKTIKVEIDSPTNDTLEKLQALPVELNVSPTRRGKGAAITNGFDSLDTDVFAFVDADGSTPAHSVQRVINPVLEHRTDLAIGSRRHPDAIVHSHQTHIRRWLGNLFAIAARKILALPFHDYQCGTKAISKEAWQTVRTHLYEPGFAWDLELIAMTTALGYSIQEIPIEWNDHPGSTVEPIGTSMSLAKALFMVRHRGKVLREDPVHGVLSSYRSEEESLIERRR